MTYLNQNQSINDYVQPIVTVSRKETTEEKFATIHAQLTRSLPHDYYKSMMMYTINSIEEVYSF